MPLSLEDLSRYIYLEMSGTLTERIDYAFSVYIDDKIEEPHRLSALQFLIFAFDIKVDEFIMPDILNLELLMLMDDSVKDRIHTRITSLYAEREQMKSVIPDYVPCKSPKKMRQLLNDQCNHSLDTIKAKLKDEMLHLSAHGTKVDQELKARYFSPIERHERNVHIRNGLFYNNMELYSTRKLEAHGKYGFAGFTFNLLGELSIFRHIYMKDRIAHSSMNAGEAVFCAGELQIEKGKLMAITTHSGHYRPNLYNLYTFLEHLVEHGVDISQTKVLTFDNPSLLVTDKLQKNKIHPHFFEIDASSIYRNYKLILCSNIANVRQELVNIYQHRDKKLLPEWLTPIKELIRGRKDPMLIESKKRFEQSLLSALSWIDSELIKNNIGIDKSIQLLNYTIDTAQQQQTLLYSSKKDKSASNQIINNLSALRQTLRNLKQEHSDHPNKLEVLKKLS